MIVNSYFILFCVILIVDIFILLLDIEKKWDYIAYSLIPLVVCVIGYTYKILGGV